MTINTQRLRKAAEGANEFIGGDVTEWPLITKNHIRFLASTAIQCADTIDAQTAEIAQLKAAQIWQPIETAPKDGRTILLGGVNSHGAWRTTLGQWMSAEYIAKSWEDPDGVEPGWFETAVEAEDPPNCWRIEPTHWMPLPAAPAALQEKSNVPTV